MTLEEALEQAGSQRGAAKLLGVDEATVRRRLRKVAPRLTAEQGDIADMIRSRGLDPAEWTAGQIRVSERASGDVALSAQLKPKGILPVPASDVPQVPLRGAQRDVLRPRLVTVFSDEHAPYQDRELERVSLQFLRDVQPDEVVMLGDLLDFGTISRHADGPDKTAEVQECIDAGYELLRDRQMASGAPGKLLIGNHDWRLQSYLIEKAKRIYGVRPAGEEDHALSLKRLLHMDRLNVQLVEHEWGWEHAKVEIAPGLDGRHGLATGPNALRKTLEKTGRSTLVGHGHSMEALWQYDHGSELLRQVHMIGCMCAREAPYTVNPKWAGGFATVSVWPDGEWSVDHAAWRNDQLYWRGERWS